MKTKLSQFITVLALTSFLLCSCAGTSWQDAAGKSLVTIAQTVDAAMKEWALYVVKNNVSDQNQATVKNAYGQYQASFAIAKTTYSLAVTNNDQSVLTQVMQDLAANQANILHAIQTFSNNTITNK